jgi:DNA-binding NarL/FixJ family response regulator
VTAPITPPTVSVLVVDDQHLFRAEARRMFEAVAGFTVVGEATTGEQAIDLTEQLRPELVLMDVVLPSIDGIEATRRILAALPRTVVVLVSSRRRLELPSSLDSCGAAGFLQKENLNPEALAALIG